MSFVFDRYVSIYKLKCFAATFSLPSEKKPLVFFNFAPLFFPVLFPHQQPPHLSCRFVTAPPYQRERAESYLLFTKHVSTLFVMRMKFRFITSIFSIFQIHFLKLRGRSEEVNTNI